MATVTGRTAESIDAMDWRLLQTQSMRGGPRLGGIGASITSANGARPGFDVAPTGYLTQAMMESSGRLKYAGHAGIGGTKAAVMLTRLAELIALPSQNPHFLVLDCFTNNMSNTPDLVSAKNMLPTLINATRQNGMEPVLTNVPPRDSGTSDEYLNIAIWNAYLARYCELNKLVYVDWHTLLVDPATGGYLSGYLLSGDSSGLHPEVTAVKVMGAAIATALAGRGPTWSPKLRSINADSLDLLANGLFLTATSGLATGWSELSAGGGTTYDITDAAPKGKWQRVAQSGSGLTWIVSSPMTVVPGNRLRWSGRMKVNSIVSGSIVNFSPVVAAGGAEFGVEGNQLTWRTVVTEGVFELDFVVPTGLTSILLSFKINGGAADVQIAQQSLVDLTAVGIA